MYRYGLCPFSWRIFLSCPTITFPTGPNQSSPPLGVVGVHPFAFLQVGVSGTPPDDEDHPLDPPLLPPDEDHPPPPVVQVLEHAYPDFPLFAPISHCSPRSGCTTPSQHTGFV